MFTIAGSGFGLYGYLPALVRGLGGPVLLPREYEPAARARPELAAYLEHVRWAPGREEAFAGASAIAIVRPPAMQAALVADLARFPGIRTVLLEKPLAATPQAATGLLSALRDAGLRSRVGYTLLHTAWNRDLRWPREGPVEILWSFMAHHFAHDVATWKRAPGEGGGPLRFFGIHVLPLLAARGYVEVRDSALGGARAGEPERWQATFAGPGVPDCHVSVDSRSPVSAFRIGTAQGAVLDLAEPFALEQPPGPGEDRRIAVLERIVATLREADAPWEALYRDAHALWVKVEARHEAP